MTAANGQVPVIEIAENAPFSYSYLPALTLYFNGTQWQTENPRRAVNYSKIAWNNMNYNTSVFGGGTGDKGVLIAFDANLSLIASEVNGGIGSVELKDVYGSYITLNGETLNNIDGAELRYFNLVNLWIYAPGMTTWGDNVPTIEIAENTPFSYSSLPETKLYFNAKTAKWQTNDPSKITNFVGTDALSTRNSIVLTFADEFVWTDDIGDFTGAILLDGATTLAADGGSVSLDAANKKITINANGTYKKISVAEGYVCGNVIIPAITLNFINGEWTDTQVYSYNGTRIAAFNLDNNNYLGTDNKYWTTLNFDAKVMDSNKHSTALHGIKVNGIEIVSSPDYQLGVEVIQLIDGLWIKFRNNIESGYNGYSHPTITFEYCSYVETENHTKVYFDELEMYLVNDKWQTEKPDNYAVYKPTEFNGVDESSTESSIVLKFSDDISWTNDAGNIAEHILLDGKTLAADGGSVVVNAANKTITINLTDSDNKYGTVQITAGAMFGEVMLPEITVYGFYDGAFGGDGHYVCTEFIGWYEYLPYAEIPYPWNCLKTGSNIDTILRFGDYEKHYFAVDGQASPSNRATQVGDGITINGVPVGQIAGVTVSYAHGFNHLYISIPVYELCPTDEYKCVELRIKEGTQFIDVVLGEVVLYLVEGQWQMKKPNTIDVPDAEGTYLTADDLFNGADGEYILTSADDNAEIVAEAKADAETTVYNFLYKSISAKFNYSLFTYVGDDFGGVRVAINHRQGDSTQGFNVFVNGIQIGTKQIAFVSDDWYAVRIAITVSNGQIQVSVAVDRVEIINDTYDYDGEVGDGIKLTKSYGDLIFANFRTGDIKRPTIDWQGKNVYKFTVGEDKPANDVFSKVLTATDNYDKADFAADSFTFEWQDGAIDNGKLVKGTWQVIASVSDKAGNTSYYTITVLVVADPNEIAVAFNVEGEITYLSNEKGALLVQPADPTKEGDGYVNYVFDGWYLGDKKWDFANDYAFEDIELSAVFTTGYKEYSVVVSSEGLDENYTCTLKLHLGATLDKDADLLKRDGYSYKIMKDGEEIDDITVDGDMEITVVYTRDKVDPAPKKSGCGGSVNGSLIGIFMAAALAFISVKKLSAKGGKDND